MASNQEEEIRRAQNKGDDYGANQAYSRYAESMERSGQIPKSKSYFGIRS